MTMQVRLEDREDRARLVLKGLCPSSDLSAIAFIGQCRTPENFLWPCEIWFTGTSHLVLRVLLYMYGKVLCCALVPCTIILSNQHSENSKRAI